MTVTNATELRNEVRSARSGDTILLAPGNYGDVLLSNINPSGIVTIKSANPDNDAVLRSLRLGNVSNLVFDDIDVSRPLGAGANLNDAAIQVNNSRFVTFSGINVSGSMNNNALDDGHGVSITGGGNISILDSTFQQLRTTVIVRGQDFLFAGNTVSQVQEGVSIFSMNRAIFEQNHMSNWQANYAAGAHPDMFQVHSGGTAKASSNLIFRDNVMLPGADPVGGIFIRSEAVGRGERHQNILIENNYYVGAYRHAISVSNADDVTIRDNTVLMGDNQGLVPAIMLGDIRRGLVEDNVSTLILEHRTLTNTGVTLRNNIDVWDSQFKTGVQVAELFRPAEVDVGNFRNLNVMAGSVAGRAGAGFAAVAEIGNLAGTAAGQMAAWLPTFDQQFAVFA